MTALTLAGVALATACSASGGESDRSAQDLSDSRDDAIDSEADGEAPGRRAQLAALVAQHLEPGTSPSTADVDADRDGDGIADALEEELLRRYRPYYKFTQANGVDEDMRPSDAIDQMRHAQLDTMNADGQGASGPLCGRAGDHLLDPPSSLYGCRPAASLETSRAQGRLCLRLDEKRSGGASLDEAKAKAVGLYGHVVQDTVADHPAYKIEYWQFFAFNNQDILFGLGDFGDHVGDWTSVQLWFDRTEHRIAKIVYLIHGKAATFHVPPNKPACRNCMVHVDGKQRSDDVGNFFDDHDRPKYDDNRAEFYADARGFKHVVVYIERGAHEFWPGSWGHAAIVAGPISLSLNSHEGNGTSYLVPDVQDHVFNAGEIGKPLTSEARTILSFNGYWGCTNVKDVAVPLRRSPPGPALHCSWKWPTGSAPQGCQD